MKRSKYKPKNPNEYKRLRTCTHPECDELGFVSYWDDPDAEHRKVEHRCIEHVHWTPQQEINDVITEAKNPKSTNIYTVMIDHKPWLDMSLYATGKGR